MYKIYIVYYILVKKYLHNISIIFVIEFRSTGSQMSFDETISRNVILRSLHECFWYTFRNTKFRPRL